MLIPLRTTEPTKSPPVITVILIMANAAAFAYQKITFIVHGKDLASIYGAIPYELIHRVDLPPPSPHSFYYSILTYMFIHGGFLHIIGNMLFLNTFGPNVEDIMGHVKFLIFYLLCGVISVVVYLIPNFNSAIPLVGASGAIAGVMGAHLRALPKTRVRCLLFIIPITLPAVIILFPWIVLQIFNVVTHEQSNVAWIAHVAGFIFGMFSVKKLQKRWFFKGNSRRPYNIEQ